MNLIPDVRRALRYNPHLRVLVLVAVVLAIASLIPSQLQTLGWWAVATILSYFAMYALRAASFADARIRAVIGLFRPLHIHTKLYPSFKWVDMYRSAEALAASRSDSIMLPIPEGLHAVNQFHPRAFRDLPDLRYPMPTTVARPINANEERALPIYMAWCFPRHASIGDGPLLLRVGYVPHIDRVTVEVAAVTSDIAQQVMNDLTEWASEHSIYRNKTMRVTFEQAPNNRFGREDQGSGLQLSFVQEREIEDEQIILDDLTRAVLEHTVIDFHRRRAQLMELGLPGKRGVLFYGPPGTGKTYTSAYLAHRLHDATKVIAAGKSLLRMADVCAIATSLQPALVILEDVDLVFSDREMAPSTVLLGEFLDQLDGFANNDQIIFILTTNVLERVEAAIKDRPGRVSQCIYFGPPNSDLRRRYLEAQTRRFGTTDVDFGSIVAQSDGASQAFLKELVLRAVQIASARPANLDPVVLCNSDFDLALREMTGVGGRHGKRIIGFQIEG
jgi:hypothetical protein